MENVDVVIGADIVDLVNGFYDYHRKYYDCCLRIFGHETTVSDEFEMVLNEFNFNKDKFYYLIHESSEQFGATCTKIFDLYNFMLHCHNGGGTPIIDFTSL